MWTEWLLVAAAVLLGGTITGGAAPPVLRALPEPTDADATKVLYRALATRGFAVGVAALSVAALAVVAARVPASLSPLWVPLASVGVLLVAIDALSTWLPLPLTRALWVTTGAGALAAIALAEPAARGPLIVRVLVGAAAVGGFFWLFWRLAGGLGFGDVRLAPILGAATAAISGEVLILGLLIGTGLGALHGGVRHIRRLAGPFPYGPPLILGSFVSLAVWG